MRQPVEFNPLSYGSIQDSIARELMASDEIPLIEVDRFEGNGVYALFYRGGHPAYHVLATCGGPVFPSPIYVGKAAPSQRKGEALSEQDIVGAFGSSSLCSRIRDHMRSIDAVENLNIADFSVRLLVLSYIWVPLAETSLISRYQPVWNTIVDGFGNHDPGAGRYRGQRPRWDTLHPGREWAARLVPRQETAADIEQDVIAFLNDRVGPQRL